MGREVSYTISILIAVIFLSGCAGKETIVTNSTVNVETEQSYVYTFEEFDISYYPEAGKFILDNHNTQREYTWNVGMNNAEDEIIFAVDSFLNNGKKQIVFHPVIGVGTGTLLEELHVVDLETLEEYVIEDFVIDEEQIVIMESLDKEKLIVGSYLYYELKDNRIIVKLNVSIETYEILGEFEGVLEEKDGKLYVREWSFIEEIK